MSSTAVEDEALPINCGVEGKLRLPRLPGKKRDMVPGFSQVFSRSDPHPSTRASAVSA